MHVTFCPTDPAFPFAQVPPEHGGSIMDLIFLYPWLVIVSLALLIPILGIVFGTITEYLRKTRVAEIEAGLKREMLDRGMSAEEIKTVLEASGTGKNKQRRCGSA